MKQRLIMMLFLTCIVPYPLIAGECEEVLSSSDTNFYKIGSEIILVHALKYHETLESLKALAKWNGATGEIISSYRTGNYRVTITRDKKNWYKICGHNGYIHTQECLIDATEQKALLSLSNAYKGGKGSLHFEREGCKVIGLYGAMSL